MRPATERYDIPEDAANILREKEEFAKQIKISPYNEVKERLDKLAAETMLKSAREMLRRAEEHYIYMFGILPQ